MTDRSTVHASFIIERTFPVPPSQVFRAFADQATKALWFGADEGWEKLESHFDFRPGGSESDLSRAPDGSLSGFNVRYYDIIADERIVYAYDMARDDARASLSITTIELEAVDGGTRFTMTEQGTFLDGIHDAPGREEGSNWVIDQLGAFLTAPA